MLQCVIIPAIKSIVQVERINRTLDEQAEPAVSSGRTYRRNDSLRSRRHFRFALLLADVVAVAASATAARLVYPTMLDPVMPLATWLSVYLIVAANRHAYAADLLRPRAPIIKRAVEALMATIAIMTLVFFYLKVGASVSRVELALTAFLSLILVGSTRAALAPLIRSRFASRAFRTVVISDGGAAPRDIENAVYVRADEWFDPTGNDPYMYDRLARIIGGANRVVVACAHERRSAWTRVLKGTGVPTEMLIPELGEFDAFGLSRWANEPTLVISQGPLRAIDAALKRGMDIVGASVALVLLAPLLVLVAMLIRLDSPGPSLFRQRRIGLGNRAFEVLKFRTMQHSLADQHGATSAERSDKRVTRIGAFLRRTSIDELPQLIVEVDILEALLPRAQYPNSYAETVHDWYGRYAKTCPKHFCKVSTPYRGNITNGPAGTDWRQWHKIAMRWVPATAAARGEITFYMDDRQVDSTVRWDRFANQSPPVPAYVPGGGSWAFSVIDRQHLVLIFGAGSKTPIRIRSVNVWQASARGNLMR